MITFAVGIAILIVGGVISALLCKKAFKPSDRPTPAHTHADGTDYVPMKRWRNSLINFLNIAGTGPILGPIQGILFGPLAFITIPIGCIIGGAVQDYLVGMISTREDGRTISTLIRKFLGKPAYMLFMIIFVVMITLLITVFTYTPADLTASMVHDSTGFSSPVFSFALYAIIIIYYLLSAMLPIHKVIGRVYPIFGGILLISAIGLFGALLFGGYDLVELFGDWTLNGFDFRAYFTEMHFIPVFFVTVACGILSGFHSTQVSLMSRTIESERDGLEVFHMPMIVEGLVAMVWAAATMAMIGVGAADGGITMSMEDGVWVYTAMIDGKLQTVSPTTVVYVIGTQMLGTVGGLFAAAACVLLPITTGDTALRAMRMAGVEASGQKIGSMNDMRKFTYPVVVMVIIMLIFFKANPDGFQRLWMYFSLFNQQIAVFALAVVSVYFLRKGLKKWVWLPAIPLAFYCFVVMSYMIGSENCAGLPWNFAYIVAAVSVVALFAFIIRRGRMDIDAI